MKRSAARPHALALALAIAAPAISLTAAPAEAGQSCTDACTSPRPPTCGASGLGCPPGGGQCIICRNDQDCQPGGTCDALRHCVNLQCGDAGMSLDSGGAGGQDGATAGQDATTAGQDAAAGEDAITSMIDASSSGGDAADLDGSSQIGDGASGSADAAGGSVIRNPMEQPAKEVPGSGCSCRGVERAEPIAMAALVYLSWMLTTKRRPRLSR
jgi:hypothetical protein